MKYAVEVENLVVRRGGQEVLHEVSAGVPTGTVVGLLGPSGSGKTTLMRAIVGAQRTASGSVTVLGSPAGDPDLRHRVGYLTQAPSVYDDLTVAQNLKYFGRVIGAPDDDWRRVMEEVGLTSQARQLVGDLSGGQLSRASLAVALLGRPELLVLDEPTVGLDPVLRRDLWNLFRSLAERGRTLIVSSHVMDEARRCDTILLLREGRVLAHLTPAELLERTGTTDADDAFLSIVTAAAA
ncbi:MAG: type transport system ATP-binding protein [Microbacteriaceae bacterium]|jgi:ABC-2 type transport system ATP-binding protein|nr:type transport system ATP-binding protein [Microbacteriaceae bacterium]